MSSRKEFLKKRKGEYFYKQAKEKKVRARSYFKLEQIDKKYNLILDHMKILDLGAAPGGWLQYMDEKVKEARILGIDLLEIKEQREFSDNVEIIEDDFNNIEDYTTEKFDLIVSDMAPEFSGDSKMDRGRTHQLNVKTLDFSKEHLITGGNLVIKSFEGEDIILVRKIAKKMFSEVKDFKPKSSQSKSAEFFIVCLNKLP